MAETKRRRVDPVLEESDTTTAPPVAEIEPKEWNGFCEIESEPVRCRNRK